MQVTWSIPSKSFYHINKLLKHLYSQAEQLNSKSSCSHSVDGLISTVQRQERKMLDLTSIFWHLSLQKKVSLKLKLYLTGWGIFSYCAKKKNVHENKDDWQNVFLYICCVNFFLWHDRCLPNLLEWFLWKFCSHPCNNKSLFGDILKSRCLSQ